MRTERLDDAALEPAPKKAKSPRERAVRALLLVCGIALFGGVLTYAGPARVAADIAHVGWGFFLLLLVPAMWRSCATTGTWFLMDPEVRLPWHLLFLVRTAGEAVNTITPFGNVAGEPVKALLLKRHLGGMEATSLVLLDKTIFFLGSVAFMAVGTFAGLAILADGWVVILTSLAMLVPWLGALVWIVWRQAKGDFIQQLARLLRFVRVNLSDKTFAKLERIDALFRTTWRDHKSRIVLSFLAHTFGRSLRAFDVWLCVLLVGSHISWYAAFFSAAGGMLVSSTFVFLPGGLGASEAGHGLVFEAVGLGLASGVSVGVIRRIRNYLIAGLSYLVLVFWPHPVDEQSP